MKTFTLPILSLVLLILHSPVQAQWVQTNGPFGGTVTSLAVSGTNLFAGTEGGGVFLSTNNGISWAVANTPFSSFSDMVNMGTNLFAAREMNDYGYGVGAFRSTNNGTSWTAVDSGLTNKDVWRLAVSETNLFAGTYGGGVFRSTNNGTSWNVANSGLPNTLIIALTASGKNLFAGLDGAGVYRSTNDGTSWTAVDSGLTGFNLGAFAVSPNGTGGTNLFA